MKKEPAAVLESLKKNAKTLQLATLTSNGEPAISYSPFVSDENGNFYIFVSLLANHTQEILNHPQVAVMLIADEQETRQIFARTRVTYQCHAQVIQQENAFYQPILEAMQARFGEVVGLLRTLADFRLIQLSPQTGRFVMGFGQAFLLVGDDLKQLQAIGPDKN